MKIAQRLAFVTAGIAFFAAVETNPAQANTINTAPIQLAQASNPCPYGTHSQIFAETSDYYVRICASRRNNIPEFYVSQAKNGSGGITVRLDNYDSQRYVATNADTSYILSRRQLVVRQGDRTILRQSIYKWVVQ